MHFAPMSMLLRFAVILTAAIWMVAGAGEASADGAKSAMINCNIQDGPCTLEVGGHRITLDIAPRPVKAMEDLTFKVDIDPKPALAKAPLIRLNMPAMDMGKNQVKMKMHPSGRYEGNGVIMRCRSGRRTWKATVDVPEIGSVDFIFDVIY